MVDEEFELVPLSPIRRMEKRLDRLEGSGMSADLLKELMEVVKTNQQVVDDVVRINSQMIGKVSDLSIALGELTNRMNDFMNRIEVSGEEKPQKEDKEEETKLNDRLSKMEKRINMMLVAMTKARPRQPMQQPLQRNPRMMGRPVP